MTDATETLCDFVATTTVADMPDAVVEHACRMVLDATGVTLRAVESEPATIAREATTGIGDATGSTAARVPGKAVGGPPGDVAFVTGVMAHALDFDDVHHEMGGHPTVPVLSALLPLAEAGGASGRDFLRAFVLGAETEIALAAVMNPGHYERGWHPTAVLGHVGAAVAAGALRRFDPETLRRTVGIAASQAGGTKANFGTMTKPYHVGNAARAGLEAAELAGAGFTADESVLERAFGGFFDLYEGQPPHEVGDVLDTLGSRWRMVDPAVGFKPYPCCGSTHAAIDAALDLRAEHGIDPARIRSITVTEHRRRLDHTDRPAPRTSLDAKFSVQYCVATALSQGDIWIDDFDEDAVLSGSDRLLDRVSVVRDGDALPNEWSTRVAVEWEEGRRSATTVPHPRGSAENPLTDAELDGKYRRCATPTIGEDAATASLQAIRDLPKISDIERIVDNL